MLKELLIISQIIKITSEVFNMQIFRGFYSFFTDLMECNFHSTVLFFPYSKVLLYEKKST